jgi:hypothetical protein
MIAPKNDKFKDYTRYAEHCLNIRGSGIATHTMRNGGRMTGGRSPAASLQANANGMMRKRGALISLSCRSCCLQPQFY